MKVQSYDSTMQAMQVMQVMQPYDYVHYHWILNQIFKTMQTMRRLCNPIYVHSILDSNVLNKVYYNILFNFYIQFISMGFWGFECWEASAPSQPFTWWFAGYDRSRGPTDIASLLSDYTHRVWGCEWRWRRSWGWRWAHRHRLRPSLPLLPALRHSSRPRECYTCGWDPPPDAIVISLESSSDKSP